MPPETVELDEPATGEPHPSAVERHRQSLWRIDPIAVNDVQQYTMQQLNLAENRVPNFSQIVQATIDPLLLEQLVHPSQKPQPLKDVA